MLCMQQKATFGTEWQFEAEGIAEGQPKAKEQ